MLLVRRAMPKSVTGSTVPAPVESEVLVNITKLTSRRRPALAGSASDNFSRVGKAKEEIEKQLKLISNSYEEIDQAQANVEKAFKVVEALLRLVNLKEHSDGVYKAALEEVWTRQSRTIDPKKFKTRVANDVFWASIRVNLEQAKQHLSEKELMSISDTVPSKATGIQLKIAKIKIRK